VASSYLTGVPILEKMAMPAVAAVIVNRIAG